MREIKFRAWDGRKIVSWENIGAIHQNGIIGLVDGGMLFPGKGEDVLEQFTGLHDKNGKEIYGGDVVKSGMTGEKYVICWSNENSAWHKEMLDNNVQDRPIYQDNNSTTVIGNIHENPELTGDPDA